MTSLITVNKNYPYNVSSINVISKVVISKVFISIVVASPQMSVTNKKGFITLTTECLSPILFLIFEMSLKLLKILNGEESLTTIR